MGAHAVETTGAFTRLAEDLWIYRGAVNCLILRRADRAVLFDCCDSLLPEAIESVASARVEAVFLTQYRRPHMAGAYRFEQTGATIHAPEKERRLIEHPGLYWNDPNSRYGLFEAYRPYHQTPVIPLACAGLREGDRVVFEDTEITAIETPGPTDGSMSYRFTLDGTCYVFSGALILAEGRVPELYSLQTPEGVLGGYHGYMGARSIIQASADKLAAQNPDVLIPSFGPPIRDAQAAAELLRAKTAALMDNYVSVSAINFYFPGQFAALRGQRMPFSPPVTMPPYILPCGDVSFLLCSQTGGRFPGCPLYDQNDNGSQKDARRVWRGVRRCVPARRARFHPGNSQT